MSQKNVLVLNSPHEKIKQYLEQHYQVIYVNDLAGLTEQLAQIGASIQIVISSAYVGLKKEWIDLMPNLEVVCNFGVGYDSTDIQALKARGIPFSNTPEVLNDAVADTAMALLLALVRQVCQADTFVRNGLWEKGSFTLTPNVSGKKVGIVGLGSIGKVIAKRLSGFDCEIAYHNRRQRDDVDFVYKASVIELAQWSDFLIIATVGGPDTRHLINHDVLVALGREGYLINIARGSVIDQEALIQALQNNTIAGAGLDVFDNEPFVPESLKQLKNVVLMPHVGSGSIEARDQMAQLVIDNLENFYQKGDVITKVV
ncbi:hydroxyacid dehydrogenase [Pelistega indica]|uniref:Hydroxyacid dehydrogenase n=1 Tax=Pelistega indica TaxID=1414851 RepID=V8FWU5_9BURK|nr:MULTISPECIES: 2-hydroxyacid dehydrogenase [Pelistega]ETD68173.1 hydroxyacid dehydrogenase [Pelistega indica]